MTFSSSPHVFAAAVVLAVLAGIRLLAPEDVPTGRLGLLVEGGVLVELEPARGAG